MPPPRSENDLKRHARRRLIGAVALTLLAVIVLPLLLEDEPPPASSLAVRMAAAPDAVPGQVAQPEQPDVAAAPSISPDPEPETQAVSPPEAKAGPKPEPVKAEPAKAEPAKAEPAKAEPAKPVATPPAPQAKPAPAGEIFVVQLAALSDPAKAQALKTRVAGTGLPVFTDTVGKLTRVRVGPFPTRAAAVAAAVKLAEQGLSGQVVAK
jgi:DedD protein